MLMEVIHHIKLFNLILFNILVFEKISNTYKNGKIGLNVWNMTLNCKDLFIILSHAYPFMEWNITIS